MRKWRVMLSETWTRPLSLVQNPPGVPVLRGRVREGASSLDRAHLGESTSTPALPRRTREREKERAPAAAQAVGVHGNGRSLNSTGTRMMCELIGNSIVHFDGSPLGASSPPPVL